MLKSSFKLFNFYQAKYDMFFSDSSGDFPRENSVEGDDSGNRKPPHQRVPLKAKTSIARKGTKSGHNLKDDEEFCQLIQKHHQRVLEQLKLDPGKS